MKLELPTCFDHLNLKVVFAKFKAKHPLLHKNHNGGEGRFVLEVSVTLKIFSCVGVIKSLMVSLSRFFVHFPSFFLTFVAGLGRETLKFFSLSPKQFDGKCQIATFVASQFGENSNVYKDLLPQLPAEQS